MGETRSIRGALLVKAVPPKFKRRIWVPANNLDLSKRRSFEIEAIAAVRHEGRRTGAGRDKAVPPRTECRGLDPSDLARGPPKVRRDLGALLLIWLGTLGLVLIAIPDAVSFLLTTGEGLQLFGKDGAKLSSELDTSARWHYYSRAGPAMAAITAGMFLQGWSIYKAD